MSDSDLLDAMDDREMRDFAIFIGDAVAGWRGESGEFVRRWLRKFRASKSVDARRDALRRAREAWLCP